MTRQRRQRIKRTDQHGDRHQLIHPPGHDHCDVNGGLIELVAALANVIQFIDQIEEGEQAKESNKNQSNRCIDLAAQVANVNWHHQRLRQRANTLIRR